MATMNMYMVFEISWWENPLYSNVCNKWQHLEVLNVM